MASAPSSLGTQIREELTCSICLELFTRPKVLPCQHTFCQHCLQGFPVVSRLVGRGIRCPIDRRLVKLPSDGVAGFPNNRIVANLCEELQDQATVSEERDEETQAEIRCAKHPSEEFRVYCKRCHEPICDKCLDESHSTHNTISLERAGKERKTAFKISVAKGEKVLKNYQDFLQSLRDMEKEATDQKDRTDKEIAQVYDRKVQQLTNSKQKLLRKVASNHRQVLERIEARRAEVLDDVSKLSSACNEETSSNNVKFLIQEPKLTEKIRNLTGKKAPTPVQKPAVFHPSTAEPKVGKMTDPSPSVSLPSVSSYPNSNSRPYRRSPPHLPTLPGCSQGRVMLVSDSFEEEAVPSVPASRKFAD